MARSNSFFQSKFEADTEFRDGQYILTFQRAKIPLRHGDELGVLQSIHDGISRTVETTEDEIVIRSGDLSGLRNFSELSSEVMAEKLIFASNLIHFFETRRPSRLIPVCFPENLFFTSGFQPAMLHYGVKDSLPPISYEDGDALQQVKAVLAVLFDPSNSFDTYVKFDFAVKTNRLVKDLFRCTDFHSLSTLMEKERKKEIATEKQSVRLPKNQNRVRNGIMFGSIVVLIPLIILTIYAFIIQMPRENLFQQSHEFFLENQYSDVATTLSSVAYGKMPKVVCYELAVSYVKNEALTDEQRTNILKDLTLQSNALDYQYWIQIGRGQASGALDTARSLNDGTLIAYALIKEKAAIQQDLSMNGKQKQERLQSIDSELKKYSGQLQKTQPANTSDGSSAPSTNTDGDSNSTQEDSVQSSNGDQDSSQSESGDQKKSKGEASSQKDSHSSTKDAGKK
ncbi:type VII secretion protein EssB [Sporolactobacillus shoreicorticis]|uniref:Type VII secretion protein EssB n=1 Tax=Sporolactobacillus shoreicorticis TaxID=1923877 RepID=A0ABW5S559_9BACL|nr:type VII secretion protein EssB [Sporolactobacillus shoreicorticis]MCO7127674.1 type VII secretion protein EssB [Sporolactobacillus shoreicorticis]